MVGRGPAFVPADAEVFILGGLVAAVFTAAGVAAYVFKRPRWTAWFAVFTIMVLLVLKATMLG